MKTVFGLIAGCAGIAAFFLLAVAGKKDAALKRNAARRKDFYAAMRSKEIHDSFTGWLERVRQGIRQEIKNERI